MLLSLRKHCTLCTKQKIIGWMPCQFTPAGIAPNGLLDVLEPNYHA